MANEHIPDREKLKRDMSEVVDKAKQAGQQRLDSEKQIAAEQAQKVAGVFTQASSQLRQEDLPKFAEYASEIGGSIKNFADKLQNRNIDDLVNETRAFARQNPTMFMLGSIAIGVALSRFLKASTTHQQQRYESHQQQSYESERAEHREDVAPMSVSDF